MEINCGNTFTIFICNTDRETQFNATQAALHRGICTLVFGGGATKSYNVKLTGILLYYIAV